MATQPNADSTLRAGGSQPPKLLERLWQALVARRYRAETVGRFSEWNRQFILFHGKRHPETMGRDEIEQRRIHFAALVAREAAAADDAMHVRMMAVSSDGTCEMSQQPVYRARQKDRCP
jgi:hypothetical protein